jgi:hypothetical protein
VAENTLSETVTCSNSTNKKKFQPDSANLPAALKDFQRSDQHPDVMESIWESKTLVVSALVNSADWFQAISGSWMLLHQLVVFSFPIAAAVLVWWWLFLIVVPASYQAQISSDNGSTQSKLRFRRF